MSTQFSAVSAVFRRQHAKLLQRCVRVFLLGGVAAVAGCAAPSQPFVGLDPADPSAAVSAVAHRSALGAYRSQRPVEPGDWIDTNERVAPRPKPGQ